MLDGSWRQSTTMQCVTIIQKLAHAYRRLSMVVASQVLMIDANEQALDFSHPIGRFYRVWFHGAAPDDLQGVEFVYRAAPSTTNLEEFRESAKAALQAFLGDNTRLIYLDDGKSEGSKDWRSAPRRALGPPLEPAKIKVSTTASLRRNTRVVPSIHGSCFLSLGSLRPRSRKYAE